MKTKEDLRRLLLDIDRKGYPAYKETRGKWSYGFYILSIDHVQGDPFASPSSVSVTVPGKTAGLPQEYYEEKHRRIALQDHLLRLFGSRLSGREGSRAGSGKSGLVITSRPGQEILERSACRVDPETGAVTMRFQVGFPANGRSINSRELLRILEDFLPSAVRKSLCLGVEEAGRSAGEGCLNRNELRKVIELADDQRYIRMQLEENGLCAFVADGSVLPRQSGVSAAPMKNAVLFESPEELALTLELPHHGPLRGMGIPKGVTLIVGGGYHGKSTLLQALEKGVYDHIAGDGREYVITDEKAVKIRAEDGRSIVGTDISLFINDLPNGKDTVRFSTEDASGSTSQAANVVEAIEAGTDLLLIDEDTSATNFMVRVGLMARVVSRDKEPITPFLARIRDLYEKDGISTILVAGSSGAFFAVSDTVIQMDRYVPREITDRVKRILAGTEQDGAAEGICAADGYHSRNTVRIPESDRSLTREDRIKLKTLSGDSFLIGREEVQLRGLEQIVDREQMTALSYIMKYMQLHILDGKRTIQEAVAAAEQIIENQGIESMFDGACVGNGLAQVRPAEIAGMLNRYRKLKLSRKNT